MCAKSRIGRSRAGVPNSDGSLGLTGFGWQPALPARCSVKGKLIVTFVVLLVSVPVFAHHSSAAFDTDHLITIKGTVTNFEWTNPHTFIYLDVKGESGNVEQWRVEGNSPNMLTRVGWTRDIIKAGDQLTVTGAPARNGSKVMRLDSVTLADDRKLDGQGFKY